MQNPVIQEQVKKLVDAGQLEFMYAYIITQHVFYYLQGVDGMNDLLSNICLRNGGWCMHDEAATHYIDMIDQTTLGHHAIKSQFNKTPRAGWQIDPFGHSAVQAYLLGAEVYE